MQKTPFQLGHIEFLNSLPLSLSPKMLEEQLPAFQTQVKSAPPATLNEAMLRGTLDVSPVSSAFYLQHRHLFTLLAQPCIASSQKVKSVLLFIPKAHNGTLALPDTSETSVALAHWYLHTQNIRFETKHYYKKTDALNCLNQQAITLTIGDEALLVDKAMDEAGLSHHYQIIDLADAWYQQTGHPCVFAVWIAQREFAIQNPSVLNTLSNVFEAKIEALQNNAQVQQELLQQAKALYPKEWQALGSSGVLNYWQQCLSYRFSDTIHNSLNLMQQQVLTHVSNPAIA